MNTVGSDQVERFSRWVELERAESPGLSDTELVNEVFKKTLIDKRYYEKRHPQDDTGGIYGASLIRSCDHALDRYCDDHPEASRVEASKDLTRYLADPENRAEVEQAIARENGRKASGPRPDRYRGGHNVKRVDDDGSNTMGPAPRVKNNAEHDCDCGDPDILKLSFEPGELAALRKNIRYLMRRWRR